MVDQELANASPPDLWSQLTPARSRNRLVVVIEAMAALLLAVLICLILVSVVCRYFLASPIVYSDDLASFIFLWLAMLGAAIAIDRSAHLRLTLVVNLLSEERRRFAETLALLLVTLYLAALLPSAFEHAEAEFSILSPALGIAQGYRVSGIAGGLVLMLVMSAIKLWAGSKGRDILRAAGLVVLILAILWGASPYLPGFGKGNIVIFLVGFVAFCLVLGVPIAFCFGIGTLSFLLFSTHLPLTVMIGRIDEGMSSLLLIAVPAFVLLGCIMDVTGMGRAIVDFLTNLVGHVRAGMSYVLLVALYLVSGISGSKIADMATVAPALFPEMKRRGGKPNDMVALLGAGAVMADTIPPSIVLIVLPSVTGLSIAGLFVSGFVVAFFLLILLMVMVRWQARHQKIGHIQRAPLTAMAWTLLIALPALMLPFIIRFAVTEGIATATEVSTIAVLYAVLSGILVYGGITPRQAYDMLVDTAALTGTILLILGHSSATAWALTQTGFALQLSEFMQHLPGGWIAFMGVTMVVFLICGSVLEGLPAIVLLSPLMFPIAQRLGIDGIHYAMVVIVAMSIGLFAPPVGIGYYVACSIGKVSPDGAMRQTWGYLLILMAGLVVIAFVPSISIGLR